MRKNSKVLAAGTVLLDGDGIAPCGGDCDDRDAVSSPAFGCG